MKINKSTENKIEILCNRTTHNQLLLIVSTFLSIFLHMYIHIYKILNKSRSLQCTSFIFIVILFQHILHDFSFKIIFNILIIKSNKIGIITIYSPLKQKCDDENHPQSLPLKIMITIFHFSSILYSSNQYLNVLKIFTC